MVVLKIGLVEIMIIFGETQQTQISQDNDHVLTDIMCQLKESGMKSMKNGLIEIIGLRFSHSMKIF